MPEAHPAPVLLGTGADLPCTALFAVAATGRSAYQLIAQASEAPFPYALSALAAVVYIAATLGLARPGETWRRVAWAACGTELVGVLVVGTLGIGRTPSSSPTTRCGRRTARATATSRWCCRSPVWRGCGAPGDQADILPLARAEGDHVAETKESARESLRSVLRNPALRRVQLAFFGSGIGDWAYATAVTVWAFRDGGAAAVGAFQAVVSSWQRWPGRWVAPSPTGCRDGRS